MKILICGLGSIGKRHAKNLLNLKSQVHMQYFAKQFYGVENVTKEEYAQSKAMSFQVLYGGVPKELETIEYFSKTT